VPAVSRTVLVIDDDPAVRELMRRFLSKEGFAVVEAGTGDEGFEIARPAHPCVVTLDVMMPGSDGRVSRILEKGDLTSLDGLMAMIRRTAKPA